MCGDGTNDAPALAQADVAVAMNTGTQAAKEAGNMVDLDSNPTKLIEIVDVGKQPVDTREALETVAEPIRMADKIVVYGASGSVGRVIVEEALSRGHEVIGVSRNPESLEFDNALFTAAPGDVTDPDSIAATVRGADVVVISVRGVGPGNTPQEAVTLRAATAYIEAASRLGDATPYVIQIGGGVTLYRDGVRPMDTLPPGTERYALAQGHWLAMEAYQHSARFDWTVMSANTGSIQERGEYTGRYRLRNQDTLVDRDGETYISRQDFAIAVIEESRTVTGKRAAVGPPY
jgi:putative NADH-flavin reductase